ncbi:hypothetical protein BD408DRAFT_436758 [Parasitella parasitica]|nr:hypothetical protein BD408DRAFT_436758 [Parasitella parasitica]
MPKFISIKYLPWKNPLFVIVTSLGVLFGCFTSLVLSAMAIDGFLKQGNYPSIVMAQEAIILSVVVAPMGLSCLCGRSKTSTSDRPNIIATQFSLTLMILELFAFFFRVGTTGFYLKADYASYYSESKQNLYVLETSAVMTMVLLGILNIPFSFSFRAKSPSKSVSSDPVVKHTKIYSLVLFLITVESWASEMPAVDEEAAAIKTPS